LVECRSETSEGIADEKENITGVKSKVGADYTPGGLKDRMNGRKAN